MVKKLIEFVLFLLNKEQLEIFNLKTTELKNKINEKKYFSKTIGDFLPLIENSLDECLHIFGAYAFKFKKLYKMLFFETKLDRYENFFTMIESIENFGICSEKIF